MVPILLTSRSSGPAPRLGSDSLKYLHDAKAWNIWRDKHLGFQSRINFPKNFADFLSGTPPLAEGTKFWEIIWKQALKENPKATNEKAVEKLKTAILGSQFVLELPGGQFIHDLSGVKVFWNLSTVLEWWHVNTHGSDCRRLV